MSLARRGGGLILAGLLLLAAPVGAQPLPVLTTCTFDWSVQSFSVYLGTSSTDPGAKIATVPVTPVALSFTVPCPTTPGPHYLSLAVVNAQGVEGSRGPAMGFIIGPWTSPFKVGASVRPTTLLNVRQWAGTVSPLAGAPQPKGTLGVILAGPIVVTGTTWWQIQYPAVTGWSAETYLGVSP